MSHNLVGVSDIMQKAVFPSASANVIYLNKRNVSMLKKDIMLKNPLSLLGNETDDLLPAGGFGAILAYAGVGKTALMVQIALNAILRNKNVLHISLNEPVNKVALWYEEVFRNISKSYETHPMGEVWETILTHRFIMTFQVEGFSVPRLKERLTDLTTQGIFFPQMLLIDGLPFDKPVNSILSDLKALASDYRLPVWFSIRTQKDKENGSDFFSSDNEGMGDFFDVAIKLQPESNAVFLKAIKGASLTSGQPVLILDPSTLLIKDKVD